MVSQLRYTVEITYISEGPREDPSEAEVPSPTAGPTSLSELQTLRTCQYSTLSLPPWTLREKQRILRLQAVISEPISCFYLAMLSVRSYQSYQKLNQN